MIDPATGSLWLNAEGESALWVLDLATGGSERVALGTHVESVAPHAADADTLFVTGRLSGLFGRLDARTGAFEAVDPGFLWPVSPVTWGEHVFVGDHLTPGVAAFNADTLAPAWYAAIDAAPDTSTTISDLILHPARETLLFANGWSDLLVELDPDTGAVLAQHTLGLPALGADDSGRVELLAAGDAALIVRTFDGWTARLEPGGDVTRAQPAPVPPRTTMQIAAVGGEVLYVGPHAVDPLTLEPLPALDRYWDLPIAELQGGDWLGWYGEDATVRRVDAEGLVIAAWPVDLPLDASPEWTVQDDGRAALYACADTATVGRVALTRGD